jgi:hypothetical protein
VAAELFTVHLSSFFMVPSSLTRLPQRWFFSSGRLSPFQDKNLEPGFDQPGPWLQATPWGIAGGSDLTAFSRRSPAGPGRRHRGNNLCAQKPSHDKVLSEKT